MSWLVMTCHMIVMCHIRHRDMREWALCCDHITHNIALINYQQASTLRSPAQHRDRSSSYQLTTLNIADCSQALTAPIQYSWIDSNSSHLKCWYWKPYQITNEFTDCLFNMTLTQMLHHILIHFLSICIVEYQRLGIRSRFKVFDIERSAQEESVYLTKCT